MTRDGVRTFLPLETSCDEPASDHPAHPLAALYREAGKLPFPVWEGCLTTPPPFYSKNVILGGLERKNAQECDLMGVRFTEGTGRIGKAFGCS